MKSLVYGLLSLFLCTSVSAQGSLEPLLNKVSFQLQAEQWVATKTALVNVSVNAALTDQGIEKIQAGVMQKLNELSRQGEWHIMSFNRQQDSSGLENIQIMAQARLPQTELANLRNKAKSISKPGETYTIDNIQFTPSDDELKQANVALRSNIYQQAKAEIDELNKLYPEQKYYLHQIDFNANSPVEAMPMLQASTAMHKSAPRTTPLLVGNKMQLQATVVIGSIPDVILQKLKSS